MATGHDMQAIPTSLSSSPSSPNLDACIVWQPGGIWIRSHCIEKPPAAAHSNHLIWLLIQFIEIYSHSVFASQKALFY